MNKKYPIFIFFLILLSGFSWNCQQTFSLAPSTAPTLTPTFTSTSTPCGYPGNTCTPTATGTPTFTSTATNTSTSTYTPTMTSTPTPTLVPPQNVLGWPSAPQNYMQLVWQGSSDPHITSYKVYRGPSSGAMTFWGSLPNSGTFLSATDTNTIVFNEYLCVVSSGTLPDSAQSNIVHAVSGTTALNSLVLSATASTTPLLSIVSGSVPGGLQRCWLVAPNGGASIDWVWGEMAASLTSVNYGFNGYGITYVPAVVMGTGVSTNLITATFNSEYWCVDYSYFNFTS